MKDEDPEAKGTDNTSVREYEEGVREPGARYLMAFCVVTGCSGSWLLTNAGPMKAEPEDIRLARYGLMEQVLRGEMDDFIAGEIGPNGRVKLPEEPLGEKVEPSTVKQPDE